MIEPSVTYPHAHCKRFTCTGVDANLDGSPASVYGLAQSGLLILHFDAGDMLEVSQDQIRAYKP